MSSEIPKLMTVREAAKALTISERTLWTLTQAGEIPRVPFGPRGFRYDARDLLAYIDRKKTSAPVVMATS
jgi:excisionase family DNA binding protein